MKSKNDANINFNPYIGDINGIIIATVKKYIQQIQTAIPAVVKKVVSRDSVIVTPAVQQIDTKWQSVPWADITLPIYTPCGNGIFLSFPLTTGDTGWIIAGDLDPSLFFKDKSKPQRQNFMDRHQYQYGFFVPDAINGYTIGSDEEGCLVIGSKTGNSRVVFSNNGLKIKSDSVIIETTDNASVSIDGTNWKTHTHGKGTLSVPITSAEGSPSTISGSTGGVN